MDDASLQRVCGLAASLRHSAHLLLDRQHKLSLGDVFTCALCSVYVCVPFTIIVVTACIELMFSRTAVDFICFYGPTDTWTLGEVLAAFSLILEVEQHTNFHVLPLNHRLHPAIPHLQFVYDLLQKIPGLRLWAKEGELSVLILS